MVAGLDWPKLFKEFAEANGWFPADVLDRLTVPQLWLMYKVAGSTAPTTAGNIAARINRGRLAKGLPPAEFKVRPKKGKGVSRAKS